MLRRPTIAANKLDLCRDTVGESPSNSRGSLMRLVVATTLLCIVSSCLAVAQPQSPDQIARANEGTVGVITGMEGGTYARTGADLTILADSTLRVLPTLGKGSLQNLSDILYLKGSCLRLIPAVNGNLTNAAKDALFQQFLVWDKQRVMAR